MPIIDRYILRQHLAPFAFGVGAFTAIFVGTDVLYTLANLMIDYKASLPIVLRIFFLSLPEILVLALPMGVLVGIILTFSRLSREGEITAFRAGGVSFRRLVAPVLFASLLIAFANIAFNESYVPTAQKRVRELTYFARYQKDMPISQNNLTIAPVNKATGMIDYFFFAGRFDGLQKMTNVVFQDYQGGELHSVIEAKEALWQDGLWIFKDGRYNRFNSDGSAIGGSFVEYRLPELQRTPAEISLVRKKPREMSMAELKTVIRAYKEEDRDAAEYQVLYHQRWAVPLASFIIALLAAPLGIQPSRAGTSMGMGISVILMFIYYMLMTVGGALAKSGSLPPVLGAWLQNIIFGGVGLLLLFRADG